MQLPSEDSSSSCESISRTCLLVLSLRKYTTGWKIFTSARKASLRSFSFYC